LVSLGRPLARTNRTARATDSLTESDRPRGEMEKAAITGRCSRETPRMIIEEFDPAGASDAEFRARWQADLVIRREREPAEPAIPYERHRENFLTIPSYRKPKYWTAWHGANNVPGLAQLELEYVDTTRHLPWLGVHVLPAARRQGTGT